MNEAAEFRFACTAITDEVRLFFVNTSIPIIHYLVCFLDASSLCYFMFVTIWWTRYIYIRVIVHVKKAREKVPIILNEWIFGNPLQELFTVNKRLLFLLTDEEKQQQEQQRHSSNWFFYCIYSLLNITRLLQCPARFR